MKCPKCDGHVKTIDRANVAWNEIFRKKKCDDCGYVFATAEMVVEPNKRFRREFMHFHKKHKEF